MDNEINDGIKSVKSAYSNIAKQIDNKNYPGLCISFGRMNNSIKDLIEKIEKD